MPALNPAGPTGDRQAPGALPVACPLRHDDLSRRTTTRGSDLDWHGVLLLWCAGCGVLALIGYGRSLAGVTRAQRAVRVPGRIAEVRVPEHGGPDIPGIPMAVAFPDPGTGQEHILPHVSESGFQLCAVWVGREIAVIHPPGRPERFEIAYDVESGQHGLAGRTSRSSSSTAVWSPTPRSATATRGRCSAWVCRWPSSCRSSCATKSA